MHLAALRTEGKPSRNAAGRSPGRRVALFCRRPHRNRDRYLVSRPSAQVGRPSKLDSGNDHASRARARSMTGQGVQFGRGASRGKVSEVERRGYRSDRR
jgi:hypothetical protein